MQTLFILQLTIVCLLQAGVALSCWCLKNKNLLENKFIVELGCGTGLSGISACIHCKPYEYWFTDCNSTVLKALNHNIQINEKYHKFNCKYDIVQLSWDNIEDFKIFEDKAPDLVLASGNETCKKQYININVCVCIYLQCMQHILFLDVVFDRTMFEPLCNSLKYFMMNSNNKTEIILFCTIRNPETYKQFLEILSKQYLYVINITQHN